MRVLKSIRAVFAGFFTVVILSTATDFIFEGLGVFPPIGQGIFITWMLVLALLYRLIYTVMAGYITAKLAPQNPMKHVTVLALIGTIAGIIGIFVGWDMSEHWYPIALAVTAYPCTWYGGKLREKKETGR